MSPGASPLPLLLWRRFHVKRPLANLLNMWLEALNGDDEEGAAEAEDAVLSLLSLQEDDDDATTDEESAGTPTDAMASLGEHRLRDAPAGARVRNRSVGSEHLPDGVRSVGKRDYRKQR